MITKLVLFLCLFCPVPIRKGPYWRTHSPGAPVLSASGRSWTSWRGIIRNTGYRYIPLYIGSTVSVPPTDGGATRLPDSAGSIREWILRRNLHRPCMPQLMEKSYTRGRKGGYGYCVMIRHAYGFVTLYGHLSACYVPEGEEVEWQSDRIHRIKRKKHGKPSAL